MTGRPKKEEDIQKLEQAAQQYDSITDIAIETGFNLVKIYRLATWIGLDLSAKTPIPKGWKPPRKKRKQKSYQKREPALTAPDLEAILSEDYDVEQKARLLTLAYDQSFQFATVTDSNSSLYQMYLAHLNNPEKTIDELKQDSGLSRRKIVRCLRAVSIEPPHVNQEWAQAIEGIIDGDVSIQQALDKLDVSRQYLTQYLQQRPKLKLRYSQRNSYKTDSN